MRVLLLLSVLLTAPAAAQETAALKPLSMVEDPVVRLSDLFETNGPRASVVLGPAPAPGQRQVVEAAQLMAIARQNGIAWRPTGGADRVVLERPGRAVEREEVLALLRNALRPQGVDPQADIELLNFSARWCRSCRTPSNCALNANRRWPTAAMRWKLPLPPCASSKSSA